MLIFVTNQLNFLDVLTPRDLIFIYDQTNIILATRERTNLVVDGCVRRAKAKELDPGSWPDERAHR